MKYLTHLTSKYLDSRHLLYILTLFVLSFAFLLPFAANTQDPIQSHWTYRANITTGFTPLQEPTKPFSRFLHEFFSIPLAHAQTADPLTGLIGYWKFDEGVGAIASDSSGNNNAGILINGPAWTTGKINGALSFNGVNTYVDAGSGSSLNQMANFSISAWIYTRSINTTFDKLVTKVSTGSGRQFGVANGSCPNALLFSADNGLTAYVINVINLNKWQHVVMTWDGSMQFANVRFYVDGVAYTTDSGCSSNGSTRVDDSPSNVRIGSGVSLSANPFNGLIDDVRVYNRVLSVLDVQALYALGGTTPPPSPTPTPPPPPPDTTPPSTPTGLTATTVSSSQINLVWTASTDNVGVTGYLVERCQGAGCTTFTQIATPSANSYPDAGLTASTAYTYRVKATDGAGNLSGYSSIVSGTTQAGGGGIPSTLGWYQIPNTHIRPVCSTEPSIQEVEGCSAVINDWDSGIFDTTRNRLIVWGGGHNGYYGNELYTLTLNNLTVQRISDPGLPAANGSVCLEAIANGTQPNARHTYDGIVYVPNVDRMFVFGGGVACINPTYTNGGVSNATWMYNFATMTWQLMNPTGTIPNKIVAALTAYDPNTGQVFVHDLSYLYAYDVNTNSYQRFDSSYQYGIDYHLTSVIDPVRKKFVMIGNGQAWFYDISAGSTYAVHTLITTGGDALVNSLYPGLAFDPVSGHIIGWNGGDTVYSLNLDNGIWTPITYTGGPGAANSNGTYKRWSYSPALNVFAVCNSVDANCYTFRLTSGGSTPDTQAPSVPPNLIASAVSSSQINISWTASTDNVGVIGYRVERCQGSSCTNFSQIATPSGTSFNNTGLTANTTYRYQVRATDAAGNLSGYSSVVSATTQQTGTSQLAQLAASMTPGTWQSFSPNNLSNVNVPGLADYSDSAAWDPIRKQLLFLSGPHTEYAFVYYKDSDNTWNRGPQLPNVPFSTNYVGHAFDGTTVNPATGDFYYRLRRNTIPGTTHDLYRYSAGTGLWTVLPNNSPLGDSEQGDCCEGIAFFPEMNSVIWVTTIGNIYRFNEGDQSWSKITSVSAGGGTWSFVEYNPVYHIVIFGNALSKHLYKMDSSGTVTQLKDIPISMYDGSGFNGHFTVDPVSGDFIALSSNGNSPYKPTLYVYDIITDTWKLGIQPPADLIGAFVVTPVNTYGVTVFASCGIYASVCDGKLYVYKHAVGSMPPSDTQAPSVPTGLTVTAVSSSQINLSWTASTDNVGVTGYRVERCQGVGCSTFAQVGTPFANSYSDTGLSANTAYTYRVRANDAVGNLSGYSTNASATTQASGGTSADADFQARCIAPGVLKCIGFDSTSNFVPAIYPASGLYPDGNGVIQGTMDTTIKTSGAGSLKFTIPSNSGANVSGYWTQAFGQAFGTHSSYYVQFRQRFSPEMLMNNWVSAGTAGWKQSILHGHLATCADVELTAGNYNSAGFPIMYTECGGRGLYTNNGIPPTDLQQGYYNCHYGNFNPVDCFYYPANQWITFYFHVAIGDWGQPNSTVEAWVAPDGSPMRQWIKMNNFVLNNGSPGVNDYDTVDLLPYMTAKSASVTLPVAYTWYDELIISTQPIAAPGAVSPTPIPGDLNSDGTVNSLDWSIMNSKWFSNDTLADLNKDGIVNSLDFSIMNSNWGRTR